MSMSASRGTLTYTGPGEHCRCTLDDEDGQDWCADGGVVCECDCNMPYECPFGRVLRVFHPNEDLETTRISSAFSLLSLRASPALPSPYPYCWPSSSATSDAFPRDGLPAGSDCPGSCLCRSIIKTPVPRAAATLTTRTAPSSANGCWPCRSLPRLPPPNSPLNTVCYVPASHVYD